MSFEAFHDEYASSAGPLRLGNWQCTDAERSSTRLGPQARNFQATLAVGDRISTSSAAASGPVAALTAMLYDHGIAVEMTRVSPGSGRRAHRDVRPRLRRRPVSVGDGLVRRPDAVRAARGHRLREPTADRGLNTEMEFPVANCES